MGKVYFISGLGADERAFQLLELSFCQPVFIQWIKPSAGETIASYASRLSAQITDPNPVIVGLSFGGMLAVEIAKQLPCSRVILISSSKSEKEIPFYLKFLRYLPFHKLINTRFLRAANEMAYKVMGVANRKDKLLFKKMFTQADDGFVRWGVDVIVNWKNQEIPDNTYHIHGTNDFMLPFKFVKADFKVKGGGHLMLLTNPVEISGMLKSIIY